jgi:hypothetical protein
MQRFKKLTFQEILKFNQKSLLRAGLFSQRSSKWT